jgi:hypothetical protein
MLRCGDILKSEPADVSHTLNRAFSATRMCAGPLPGACAPALKLNRAAALADRLTFRLTGIFPVGQAQRHGATHVSLGTAREIHTSPT